ncbi:MAG: tripartite tricarboxylate transporter substrate-binding protein [Burkholderiales bacterium]
MKKIVTLLFVAASTMLPGGQAAAQAYPNKSIRIVLPWPPGGITDVIMRAVNIHLSEVFAQQLVIDNRPGAGGTLGAALVAKAPADGYTLLMHDIASQCISASLYGSKLSYDPLKDFQPIMMVAGSPMVLVANPSPQVRTLPQLIALAKSRPGQLNYASSGAGSITHLAAVRMQKLGGVDIQHVPFKGSIPAASSVMNGETFMSFSTIPASLPHAKTGRLVMIAQSFAKRSLQIPDVPTIAETLGDFDLGLLSGLWAPPGTPRAVVDRLHTETMRAMEQPKVKEILAANSAIPGRMNPQEFADYLARETRNWGEIVRTSGVKID